MQLKRPATDASQRHQYYDLAKMAFMTWLSLDPELLALGVEKSSLLLQLAIEHAVGNGHRGKRADRDGIAFGELFIAEKLMETLGPSGSDILDFTIQTQRGRTMKWLSRGIVEKEPNNPLAQLPDVVDCSVPFFLQIVPSVKEKFQYKIWPLYLLGVLVMYYVDLTLDVLVAVKFYTEGTRDEDPQPEKLRYFWSSVSLWLLGLMVTCLFDVITTLVTKADRQNGEQKRKLAVKVLMNILLIRMPYEIYRSFRAMQTWQRDAARHKIDKTARQPPMSMDQVKCAEGVFEAVPQSILQAFVVIADLTQGLPVGRVQVASLFTSWFNIAGVLGMMGPPDISELWRVTFMMFVSLNVVLRSLSFAFMFILILQDANELDFGDNLEDVPRHWNVGIYMLGSYLTTCFFIFVVGGQSPRSIPMFIVSLIALIVPLDMSKFTIVKAAQPQPAQLPFAFVRFAEIGYACWWFASQQDYHCVSSEPIVCSNSTIQPTGLYQAFANTTTLQAGGTTQWVFYESEPAVGAFGATAVHVQHNFPFNIASVLTFLLMLNITTYVICAALPYKSIDSVPAGFKRLWFGNDTQRVRDVVGRGKELCCRGKRAIVSYRISVGRQSIGPIGTPITLLEKTFADTYRKVSVLSRLQSTSSDPGIVEETAEEKKHRKEKRKADAAVQKQEAESLQRDGLAAIQLLSELVHTVNAQVIHAHCTVSTCIVWLCLSFHTVISACLDDSSVGA